MRNNPLFDAVLREKDPMFDAAVVTADGLEYLGLPNGNRHNNCHSATKFFVASMIGMLCDEKKLRTEDKIVSFFPGSMLPKKMDPSWKDVTVGQTMQHKIGLETIPFGVDDDGDYPKIREKYGEDFLQYVLSLKIEHAPGTVYRYSDAAYYLLCRLIEAVSGMNAETYLRKKIANPLGWAQWGMSKTPDGTPVGGDGLYASSADMAKWMYVCACDGKYCDRRMLSSAFLSSMRQNDYATTRFRDTDIWLKTGANGQGVAYSFLRPAGVAWHGFSTSGGARNDRMFLAFRDYLDERFGTL